MLLAPAVILWTLPATLQAQFGDTLIACEEAAVEYFYLAQRLETLNPDFQREDYSDVADHWAQLRIYIYGRWSGIVPNRAQERAFDTQAADVPNAVAALSAALQACQDMIPR